MKNHQVDGCVAKVYVLLLEQRKRIVIYAVEYWLFPCFLGAKIIDVQRLLFLVLRYNLFALSRTQSAGKGLGRIRAGVGGRCVDLIRVGDYDSILFLGYRACEESVALSFGEMVRLQYCIL